MPKELVSKGIRRLIKREKEELSKENEEEGIFGYMRANISSEASALMGVQPYASTGQLQKEKAALLHLIVPETAKEEMGDAQIRELGEHLSNLLSLLAEEEKTIKSILGKAKEFQKQEKSFLKKTIQIEEENKKRRAMLAGEADSFSSGEFPSQCIKSEIKKGTESLSTEEERLGHIQSVQQTKASSLRELVSEIEKMLASSSLEKKAAEKLLKKIKNKKSFLKAKKDIPSLTQNLLSAVKEETGAADRALHIIEERLSFREEDDRLKELLWIEKQHQKATKQTLRFLNQFIIPRMKFPSGNYASYAAEESEAKRILSAGKISAETARTEPKEIVIGSRHQKIPCITYIINGVERPSENCELLFMFPVESVMKKRYFIIESLTSGTLEVFDRAPDAKDLIVDVENTLKKLDALVSNINETRKKWIEEAKRLNKDFVVRWDETARQNIENDFTKRWIKEEADSFSAVNKLSFDIIHFLVEQRYFASLYNRLFQKTKKTVADESQKDENDYLEEMQRMTLSEFLQAIKEIKEEYKNIIRDARNFAKTAGLDNSTENGIFVAPRRDVLKWEEFFEGLKKRPRVFYYDGEDIQDAARQAIEKCKENRKNKEPPKTRLIRIYSYLKSKPLQSL